MQSISSVEDPERFEWLDYESRHGSPPIDIIGAQDCGEAPKWYFDELKDGGPRVSACGAKMCACMAAKREAGPSVDLGDIGEFSPKKVTREWCLQTSHILMPKRTAMMTAMMALADVKLIGPAGTQRQEFIFDEEIMERALTQGGN